ncbi:uncharacterized protein LY79DRAFT_687254 [Colletotrichum navitas]|uniref:Pyrroloquinoline quinone-dependent pyranose dehydrogenase beta-propeller domain-containing protein n=1 Tax=Colletotrichum navitas TaxID=681940 RepID=A0AAD8PZL4_9PEZI|nr:uncharacterized protein LY79DRAFT_687254 [Colletotrichum navitas]KAK1590528.1 hypothetical protein LY79DRAFT_687254 [Colletotrichum navitas]
MASPNHSAMLRLRGRAATINWAGAPGYFVIDTALSQGALLFSDARSGIKHLTLNDDGDTYLTVSKERTIDESSEPHDSNLNHGIGLPPNGGFLYASTADRVYAWFYDVIEGIAGDSNRTIVINMHNTDHTTRTLLLPNTNTDILLVSRGSVADTDGDAARECTGHSQFCAFDIGSLGENS